MDQLPSRAQLTKIGKALAAGRETPEQLDALGVVLGRCDEVQVEASDVLNTALASFPTIACVPLTARGRAKTLTTLREKLDRMGGQTIPVIRDLAGLRIVGDITLDEQDEVLRFACDVLGVEDVKVIDRRTDPMRGYRALHAEFVIQEVRVELQVRTQLQHLWAEVYERAGDRLGRRIRYPDPEVEPTLGTTVEEIRDIDDPVIRFLSLMTFMSDLIRRLEAFEQQYHRAQAGAVSPEGSAARMTRDAGRVELDELRDSMRETLQSIAASADDSSQQAGGQG